MNGGATSHTIHSKRLSRKVENGRDIIEYLSYNHKERKHICRECEELELENYGNKV